MNTLSVLKVRLFCLFLTKYIKACKVKLCYTCTCICYG